MPESGDGLVVVDKPSGLTSHDVVARVRRLAGTRRVGHAGTLDPMATGVLLVGVNRATKLLTYLVGADKEYTATIRLGETTVTDDAEGDVTGRADASGVTAADVAAGARALTGDIAQVPSSVSAIKVDGRRAYARARAGETVELAARPVTVREFEVGPLRPHGETVDLDARVVCTSGTYVRALARDLGAGLGVGGHLTALRRTRVGRFTLDGATTLEDLGERFTVTPLAEVAAAMFDVRHLTASEARDLGFGRPLTPTGVSGVVAALAPSGDLAALLTDAPVRGEHRAKPEVVFAPARPPGDGG